MITLKGILVKFEMSIKLQLVPTLVLVVFHWSTVNFLRSIPIKKTDSPSLSSYQLLLREE